MREGFYRLEFRGRVGLGCGVLALDTEMVVGADTEGGKYAGKYVWNEQTKRLDINVTVSVPEGTLIVQGERAPQGGLEFQARCSFPREPDNYEVQAETDFGPVVVCIHFLRDFPL